MTFRMTGIKQLLARHGENLTLRVKTGTYDPTNSTIFRPSVTSHTVRGYFYDSRNNNIYDTQIDEGTRRVVLYPTTVEGFAFSKPMNGDVIEGRRDRVSVVRSEEIMSNDKVLFYLCRVRE